MISCTIFANLTGMLSSPVEVSVRSDFNTLTTSPYDTSLSWKADSVSLGSCAIRSDRQSFFWFSPGRVCSTVSAKNLLSLSGSERKGFWLGFRMRCITCQTSFGLLEESTCFMKSAHAYYYQLSIYFY